MIRKQAASAILAAVALQASLAHGLGLGTITLRSALNEPLDAEIRLRGIADLHPDQIRIRLGTPDDFERAGVERLNFLSELRFEVSVDRNGDGMVHISSSRPVHEPYLDFIVEARWPSGRALREYTLLLDLPTYTSASAPPVSVPARQSQPDRGHAGGDDGGLAPGHGEYRVRGGDTLWRIADRSRPAGVSVRQMLNAIHRDNPQAFIGGNIDRLLAGVVLRLPQGGDLSALTSPETPLPDTDSAPVVEPVPAPAAPVEGSVQGGEPQAGEPQTGYTDGDHLEISGDSLAPSDAQHAAGGETPVVEAKGVGTTDGALRESQESLLAAERANEELQGRVKALEAQVADFQKLAEIDREKPAAPPAAEPPVAESPSLIERLLDSTLTWLALALALLGAMVAFLLRRRRETVQEFVPVPFDGPRMPGALPERAVKERAAAPGTPAPSAAMPPAPAALVMGDATDADGHDPVSAAEVYLTYGQPGRAEQVLRDALRGHGDLQDVRLKLMDILAERGDESEFLRHYGALDGNISAQREANAILDRRGLGHWVAEPTLNREKPLEIDLAAELQQVADTLGAPSKPPAAGRAELLSKTEEAIARAAAELGSDADAFGGSDLGIGAGEFDLDLDGLDDYGHDALSAEDSSGEDGLAELPLGEFELDAPRGTSGATTLDEDLALLAGSDETATKLELARAYLDMGDDEGARDILEEVASEGDAAQREEATALLARIGGNS